MSINPRPQSVGGITPFVPLSPEEKERLQSTALETVANGVLITDTKGVILWVNPAFVRLTGYTAGELLGKNPRLLKSGKHDREFYKDLWKTILAGKTWRGNFTNRRKDGTLYHDEHTITPVRSKEGAITHFVAIMNDVTERKEAEDKLLWKTAFLEAQVNSALNGILVVDSRGNKIVQNQQMIELWNIPREFAEEVDDRRQFGWVTSLVKDPRRFVDKVEYLQAHLEEISQDELELKDGRFFDRHSAPVRGTDGTYYGRIWTFRDITQRKQAERATIESERKFRLLAENITDVFWIASPDLNRIDYVSPGYETIWGCSAETLYANPHQWSDFILPEDRERVLAAFGSLMQDEPAVTVEYRITRSGGTVRWVLDRGFQVRDADNRLMRLTGIVTDITERKRAEEQIREQAALLDEARDAIVALDLNGKVLFWNQGAERMYGWTRDEVLGRDMSRHFYKDFKVFEDSLSQTMSKGEWSGEMTHLTKDSWQIMVESRRTLIRDNGGNPKSILVINTNITEKKKIEAQYMRAQRMENIGALAGGIAHDLNNILSPIMMSIDILKATSDSPQKTKILETIELSTKRGADIVRQVLSFARGVEGERVEVQPGNLLGDLENIIKCTFPKNIRLQFSVPADTWAIKCDPTQAHQILLNLCVNARDAMPDGGVLTVGIENCVLDEQYVAMNLQSKVGSYVAISVTDTGSGIPVDVLDKIFDPFFTTKEVGKGTGLGLSTVMTIVKSHAGHIDVHSELGKGTTFKVCLPAMVTTGEAQRQQAEPVNQSRGHGETVLVIDDEVSILTITSQTLQAFGYRVLTATDGAEAVAAYAEHMDEIAVVLTDMVMPVMDGPATIHALKRLNPAVKIIVASGFDSNDRVAKASGFGVRNFLTKPYTAGTLLKAMRDILDEA